MKVKTFKKGEDKAINDFVASGIVILGFNILQDGDVFIQYKEEVYGEYDAQEYYKKELGDNLRQKATLELDLEYESGVKGDEETGKRKREIQKKIERLEVEEAILKGKLA